jgi:inhibitor of cysteine peptidase
MHLNIDRTHLQHGRRLLPRPLSVSASVLVPVCAVVVSLSCAVTHAVAATLPPITVTQQDSGKTIEVAVGQKVIVQLASNPTTGYQWSVLGNTAPLKLVKSDYAADPQVAGRIGAGGTQTLRFTARSSGKVELKLGYARPWEKDVPLAKTFSVTIIVK